MLYRRFILYFCSPSSYTEPTCQDHFKEKIRWIEYGDQAVRASSDAWVVSNT